MDIPSISNIGTLSSRLQFQRNQENVSSSRQPLPGESSTESVSQSQTIATETNEILGFEQALANTNDVVSVTQVSGGLVEQIAVLIQEIRISADRAANPGQSAENRDALQLEINSALSNLNELIDGSSIDEKQLFSQIFANQLVPVGTPSGETVDITIGTIDPDLLTNTTLGSLIGIDITTEVGAQIALELAGIALENLAQLGTGRGSDVNTLEDTLNSLSGTTSNIVLAEDAIRDETFTRQETDLNRAQLLLQERSFTLAPFNEGINNLIDIFG